MALKWNTHSTVPQTTPLKLNCISSMFQIYSISNFHREAPQIHKTDLSPARDCQKRFKKIASKHAELMDRKNGERYDKWSLSVGYHVSEYVDSLVNLLIKTNLWTYQQQPYWKRVAQYSISLLLIRYISSTGFRDLLYCMYEFVLIGNGYNDI